MLALATFKENSKLKSHVFVRKMLLKSIIFWFGKIFIIRGSKYTLE